MPTETGKQHSRQVRPIALPKHMKPSEDELAIVSRLVRVLRNREYWLGAFIERLLDIEAMCASDETVSIEFAQGILEKIRGLETWRDFIDAEENRPIRRYFGHKLFPEYVYPDSSPEQRESGDFVELVQMWRLDHPAPPKRRQIPAGHLEHEESGD